MLNYILQIYLLIIFKLTHISIKFRDRNDKYKYSLKKIQDSQYCLPSAIMIMFKADTDTIVYCKGHTTIQVL